MSRNSRSTDMLLRVKQVVAAANLVDVPEPEGAEPFYDNFVDAGDKMFHAMHNGFLGLLYNRAQDSGFGGPSKMVLTPENALVDKHMELCGSTSGVAHIRTSKTPAGYKISLPIILNTSLFSGFLDNAFQLVAKTYDDAWEQGRAKEAKAIKTLLTKLVGEKPAEAFFKPKVPFDAQIVSPMDGLTDSPVFDLVRHAGNKENARNLVKYFKGFRIIAPPLKSTFSLESRAIKEEAKSVLHHNEAPGFPLPKQIDDMNAFILSLGKRQVSVFAEILIPEAFVRYMVQTAEGNIDLKYLNYWASIWYSAKVGDTMNDYTYVVTPLRSIRAVEVDPKKKEATVKKTHNRANLAMDMDGYPIYIPDVDHTEEFETVSTKFLETDNGEYAIRDARALAANEFAHGETRDDKEAKDAARGKLPRNSLIYTDWAHQKLNYTDNNGVPSVIDLDPLISLTATHATNLLDREFNFASSRGKRFIREFEYFLRNRVSDLGLRDPVHYIVDSMAVAANDGRDATAFVNILSEGDLTQYLMHARRFRTRQAIKDQDDFDTYSYKDLFDPKYPEIAWIGKLMQDAMHKIDKMATKSKVLDQYVSHRSVENSLYELGLIMAFGRYGPTYDQMREMDLKHRDVYLNPKKPEKYKPVPVPYLKDERFLMPHQVRVDSMLETNDQAKFVLLAADPGGGKTSMCLRHAVRSLQKKKFRKPLLVVPSKLINNYLEEAIYFYGGNLNMIPITTATVARYGMDGIARMVSKAPPNTILLTTYNFLGRMGSVYYSVKEVTTSPNADFLIALEPGAIYCDESHNLRNESNHTKNTRKLAHFIPYRFEATGTFVNNNLADVPNQMTLFDTSIFGSKEEFKEEYALEMRGSQVIEWKPGAEKLLAKKVAQHVLYLHCRRKEWAALLPEREEELVIIDPVGTKYDEWYDAYQALLIEEIEIIKKNEKLMKKLQQLDNTSDEEEMSIENELRPFIQKLERFCTAPQFDKLGEKFNLVGPSIEAIQGRINKHIKEKVKGKILIFTAYHPSADAIFESLPPGMKGKFVRYHPSSSAKDLAKFQRDPNILGLIGTFETLKEGHNLQAASRLILVESPWTPGNLEQIFSRVYRPDPKNLGGKRETVYVDHILVNRTISITKCARLISKTLVKAAFDEHDNPAFDGMPTLEVVSMTLESIAGANNYQSELLDYAQAYSTYQSIRNKDLREYRDDPANEFVYTPIKKDPKGIEGQALLTVTPYVDDMPSPFRDEFGLLPILDYISDTAPKETIETYDATGLKVNTEYGDAIVSSSNKGTLKVKLIASKGTVTQSVAKASVLVYMDQKKTVPEYKHRLADQLKMDLIKDTGLAAKPSKTLFKEELPEVSKKDLNKGKVPVKPAKPVKQAPVIKPLKAIKPAVDEEGEEMPTVELEAYAINELIAVGVVNEDLDEDTKERLIAAGFKDGGKYTFAHIKNRVAYANWLEKLQGKFSVPSAHMAMLKKLQAAYSQGPKKLFSAHRAVGMELKNFWRMQIKPAPKGEVRPYPVVTEDALHVAFRWYHQPSAAKVAALVKVPGVTYEIIEDELLMFAGDKAELKSKLAKLEKAGIVIHKPKTLMKEIDALRMVKPKVK